MVISVDDLNGLMALIDGRLPGNDEGEGDEGKSCEENKATTSVNI